MSDAELRALEQAWRASGLEADERAYLNALRRAGRLDYDALEIAAYVGDAVAEELLEGGLDVPVPDEPGIEPFLDHLPGPGDVKFRAARAVLRAAIEASGRELSSYAVACFEAAEACGAAGAGATELLAARAAAEAHETVLAQSPRFVPSQPLIAYVITADPNEALDRACWVLARYAGGLEQDTQVCGNVGSLIRVAELGEVIELGLRGAVRAALLPWVLLRDEAPPKPSEPPASLAEALLGGVAMTEAEARAVTAAADDRRALEAFYMTRGYTAVRDTFVNLRTLRKVTLLKRAVQVFVGGPGKWRRLPGTTGHELLIVRAAAALRELAHATLSDGLAG